MRTDSRGNPDVCREVFSPVRLEAQDHIKAIKLNCNSLIAFCRQQIDANRSHEVKRLFAMAAHDIEVGSMLAVKALTSEEWGSFLQGPSVQPPPQEQVEPRK